jgi:oxygen-independent coproporphyrinogen-3 oxidase
MSINKKILEFTKRHDPCSWWREYPPKFMIWQDELSPEKINFYINRAFNNKNNQIGLYAHLPFCKTRCFFCSFYSEVKYDKHIIARYLDCLEKELSLYNTNFKNVSLNNIYIGGGTPTLLNREQWTKLFKIINKHFIFKKNIQILTEGTPESSNFNKLKLLKKLGVNRYTIGVQSFDDKVLNKINRKHSSQDIHIAYKNARKAGIEAINFDILFGLPGETENTYLTNIKNIILLKPDCVSLTHLHLGRNVYYSKNQLKQSYLYYKKARGRLYYYFSEALLNAGYIMPDSCPFGSYFVLPDKKGALNQSLINRRKLNPMLGIGSNADSILGYHDTSFQLVKYTIKSNIDEYCTAIENNNYAMFKGIELKEDEAIRQYLVYSLFFWGKLDKGEFKKKFKKDLSNILARKFSKLKKHERVIETKDAFFLLPELDNRGEVNNNFVGNREGFFFFCLEYIYSTKLIAKYKKHINTLHG